jgi:hypothetical protein
VAALPEPALARCDRAVGETRMDEHLETNRTLWAWTRMNLGSRVYDVAACAGRRGRDLDPIARAGSGDVLGQSLLHLQASFRLLDAEAPTFRASHVIPPRG